MTTATHQHVECDEVTGLAQVSPPLCEEHCDELQTSSTILVHEIIDSDSECEACLENEMEEEPTLTPKRKPGIYLSIDRPGYTNGLQVSIEEIDEDGNGNGCRIAGPKYLGDSTNLRAIRLDGRDAERIRRYIDKIPADETA